MTHAYYDTYWQDQEELSDLPYKWPVLKRLLPHGKKIFLDFGCGKGIITQRISTIRPEYTLYGADVSKLALNAVRARIKNGTFKLIAANQKIPFKDNSFDVILASDVLEHIYDTKTALSEISRVLKPEGALIITVPYNGKLKMIIAILIGFEFYFDPMSPHIRHFSPKTLTKSVTQSGLTATSIGYYGRFYPFSRGMYCIAKKLLRSPTHK